MAATAGERETERERDGWFTLHVGCNPAKAAASAGIRGCQGFFWGGEVRATSPHMSWRVNENTATQPGQGPGPKCCPVTEEERRGGWHNRIDGVMGSPSSLG